jgi:NADH-quinone oxidoreductase subunit L
MDATVTQTVVAPYLLLEPLGAAAIIALFLRKRGNWAAAVSVVAAVLVCYRALKMAASGLRFEGGIGSPGGEWLRLGDFVVSLGVKYDDLAALMLCIVGIVGLCVHVFSLGYLKDDAAKARYFGGLSMFMFSMLGIVLADNLFMMFMFWELVGFSSWLLIGHWFEKQSASDAAKKAFIANRVGDFGFLLGIVMCWWINGTVNFTALAESHAFSTAVPLLLFCGAVGKSAQLPLQVWLPDAMEGPTPVSALIHAATMVAAGVFMLCRIEPLMVPDALTVILWTGVATALYAALCAVVQRDIKKVLAYSTLSQLGFMVAAFGLGSVTQKHGDHSHTYALGVGAAMFHLTTHAFFKALLFLGSGSVIHGCHHEQDIFKMGGLRTRMPWTFWTFTVGVLAIIGFPFIGGFFSKEAILLLAYEKSPVAFGLLAFTALLTSLYMVRLWKITFLGAPRSDSAEHAHEGGAILVGPLLVLAGLALWLGRTEHFPAGFAGVLELVPDGHAPAVMAVGVSAMLIGAAVALLGYAPAATDSLAAKSPLLFGALVALRNAFDSVYDAYVAKVQQRAALLLNYLEYLFLSGAMVRGLAGAVGFVGMRARALHTGNLGVYVYWFLLGLVLLWGFATGSLHF